MVKCCVQVSVGVEILEARSGLSKGVGGCAELCRCAL